ncbi:uncharacterized protein [Aegilops tauschii subsp. strangulata]|uniref:uncharacterized protein n=1 Tax=Aegilops tauschii subsp. strangulata TaxID=200361 RepID=UPI003CC89FEF
MTTQPPKVLVWNVRGLNSPARRSTIFQAVDAAKVDIVCLQETKMEVISSDIVRQTLGNRFENFYYVPAVGTRGGILLAWDHLVVSVTNSHLTMNTITTLIKQEGLPMWWLTGVYGPQGDTEKVVSLEELRDVRGLHASPWAIVGDFNLIVNPGDKNKATTNRRMMATFRAMLNRLELKDLYLNGRRYTWSNERRDPTMEKIDHIFVTNCWEDIYPKSLLTMLGSAISDHCPLLVDLDAEFEVGRRFKFECLWPKAVGFLDTVEQAWQSIASEGNPLVVLDSKLRVTAKALQSWSDRWIGNTRLQIALAMEIISRLEVASEARVLSDQEHGFYASKQD